MKPLQLLKIILGFLALAFGFIGLFLPIWPTTPFVLLALGCFSTTPKLQAWLLRIKFFREYFESYTLGCPLKKKTVMLSLTFLWGMLTLSCVLVGNVSMTVILGLIGLAVTVHILYMTKTRTKVKKGEIPL